MHNEVVNRARAMIGTPFLPQGRDVHAGVDCVGLALAAYALPAGLVRADYRLRGQHVRELQTGLLQWFRRISRTQARAGDLVLALVDGAQCHLAIKSDRGFIHADAALRSVVERPGALPWRIVGVYRQRTRKRKAS